MQGIDAINNADMSGTLSDCFGAMDDAALGLAWVALVVEAIESNRSVPEIAAGLVVVRERLCAARASHGNLTAMIRGILQSASGQMRTSEIAQLCGCSSNQAGVVLAREVAAGRVVAFRVEGSRVHEYAWVGHE